MQRYAEVRDPVVVALARCSPWNVSSFVVRTMGHGSCMCNAGMMITAEIIDLLCCQVLSFVAHLLRGDPATRKLLAKARVWRG